MGLIGIPNEEGDSNLHENARKKSLKNYFYFFWLPCDLKLFSLAYNDRSNGVMHEG